jgi:hypothetical protein
MPKIYQQSYSMTKEQIKALVLDLIGEDDYETGSLDRLREELRQKVNEL